MIKLHVFMLCQLKISYLTQMIAPFGHMRLEEYANDRKMSKYL